ncbi:ABC transporter A family member 12 [Zancudomyces culisetae]|uniref:ABC transporter A family member 12 n=1 Tax=Zancudomyces culisetae TaxID=1213189 RepID=A0A1R1PS49_ZANCU|nr:ABC transporter A family member 12 [Zancudomyces culisetae]|eukprot:OMH83810.1 ABC transporter A family member 12 [Zancudomyces culisetae]
MIVRSVAQTLNSEQNYLMCSNKNASDIFNIPINNYSKEKLPMVQGIEAPNLPKDKTVYHLNHYLLPMSIIDTDISKSGALSITDRSPSCVWQFEHSSSFSSPYEISPNISDALRRDSTMKPDPAGGWFNVKFLQKNFLKLLSNQKSQFVLVRDSTKNNAGSRVERPLLVLNAPEGSNLSGTIIPDIESIYSYVMLEDVKSSLDLRLLNQIKTNFFMDVSQDKEAENAIVINGLKPVPWFDNIGAENSGPSIDDTIKAYILSSKDSVITTKRQIEDYVKEAQASRAKKLSQVEVLFKYYEKLAPIINKMPWGALLMDKIDPENSEWQYTMQFGEDRDISILGLFPSLMDRLITQHTQLTNAFLRTSLKDPSAMLSHGLRAMPQFFDNSLQIPIGGFVGAILYPFGVSFLIPIFVMILVKEKESKIMIMMRMNGIRTFVVINTTVNMQSLDNMSFMYLLWPPFAMYRALYLLNISSMSLEKSPYQLSDLKPHDGVFNCFMALVVASVIYLLLTVYFGNVLSQGYGIKRPWYFFLRPFNKRRTLPGCGDRNTEIDLDKEDEDVKNERLNVEENLYCQSSPLVLHNVQKRYKSGKYAIKNVTMAVESDCILGLLGPNGAGKTTLISMLSGLHSMTSGSAKLDGYDVGSFSSEIYFSFGICPQHDILWEDLTVTDHLYFYARLKGIEPSEENDHVNLLLNNTMLYKVKEKLVRHLSGGQRRMLSLVISFIGNPRVIFLDEPTVSILSVILYL